jgi:hypothetical protein
MMVYELSKLSRSLQGAVPRTQEVLVHYIETTGAKSPV